MDRQNTNGPLKKTGITYHTSMQVGHSCLWDEKYPECPQREEEILKRCAALNLIDRCQFIDTRRATKEEVQTLHSETLTTLLEECEAKPAEELEQICSKFDSIFISNDTNEMALTAAGSTINLIDAICSEKVRNGMAIVRPPGHHAMTTAFCGYCYFNNVALAAKHALEEHKLKRILIVDWDVHHGQATQQMFYSDPRVLYFSIHRYEHGRFWPNLIESDVHCVGEGEGKGFNINVPLNEVNLENEDYLSIFHQVLLPVAAEYRPELIIISAGYDAAIGCFEFDPQLIIVSCGFDAAIGDRKGEMYISPACYAHFIHTLSQFCGGKIAVVLEGGYCLKSLAESAALTLRALLGDSCPQIHSFEEIDESTKEIILNVMYHHRPYWNCFKHNNVLRKVKDNEEVNLFVPRSKVRADYVGRVQHTFETRIQENMVTSEEKQVLIDAYNKEIDILIENTNLLNYKHRCLAYSCVESKNYQNIATVFDKMEILTNPSTGDMASIVMQSIMENITRSVIVDMASVNSASEALQKVINAIDDYSMSHKILLIDLDTSIAAKFCSNNTLVFNFERGDIVGEQQKYLINIPISHGSENDNILITYWLRLLLPIAYQHDPKIVIVSSRFSLGISPAVHAHLVHWLTNLSDGKLIFLANYDSENSNEVSSLDHICKSLNGYPCTLPATDMNIRVEDSRNLKKLMCELQTFWYNIDFDVNYYTL